MATSGGPTVDLISIAKQLAQPLGEAMGTLGTAAEKTATTLAKSGVALNAFGDVFTKVIGAMGTQLTRFVQLANPAVVMRFNMALDNAMSAMGRVFVPVLERFTLIVQKLGNAIESLNPQTKQLLGGLAAGSGLAGALGAVATAGALVVKVLGGWVTAVVALVGAFAGIVMTMSSGKQIAAAFDGVLKQFGAMMETVAKAIVPIAASTIVPVLERVGKLLAESAVMWQQLFGALSGGMRAGFEIFGAFVGVLVELTRVSLSLITPVLVPLAAILSAIAQVTATLLIPVLEGLAAVIKRVADFINDQVQRMLKLVGLAGDASSYDPNAKTAQATRQSNITDLRSFANRNYTLAYGGASDVPKATLEEAKKQSGLLGQIYSLLLGKNGNSTGNPMTASPAPESRGTFGRSYAQAAVQTTLAGPILAMNVMRSLFD